MAISNSPGTEDALLFEKHIGVATLNLNRPKALELLFTGDNIDAGEALGLVNRLFAADELSDATRELGERLARGPTLAQGASKAAVYESENLPFESLLDFEARNQRVVGRSDDVKEGIRAFLERRKPEFRGR